MARTQKNFKKQNSGLMPARMLAVYALDSFQKDNIEIISDDFLQKTFERQRTTDLIYGTIRNQTAIDLVITSFAGCPVKRIQPKIINIIRIAVYELIYCPQTPAYSIVNEAVEIAKKISGKKQAAFVNSCLRQISSHITDWHIPLTEKDSAKILPQSSSTGCLFDSDFLPDSKSEPSKYLSTVFSLPQWMISGWLEEFGQEKTKQICLASNRRPSVYLRINTLKTSVKDLSDKLKNAKLDFQVIDDLFILIKSPKQITQLPGFADGLFTIQDPAAVIAVQMLKLKQGDKILDLCAAPGTKTVQLAELTEDRSQIFATDIDNERLALLEQNIKRLQLKSITVFKYDQLQKIADTFGPFDYCLLDVPCSNTAVLARRAEVRMRITEKAIDSLAEKQFELLQKAGSLLKPGDKICYSTCSLQPQENTLIIKNFLEINRNFVLEQEKLTLPSADFPDHDGSYAAILMKR